MYISDNKVSQDQPRSNVNSAYEWVNEGLGQPPLQQVENLMKQLQPLFIDLFKKYGQHVGKDVKFRPLKDKEFNSEMAEEGKRRAESALSSLLNWGPEIIALELRDYYAFMRQQPRKELLNRKGEIEVSGKTKLNSDEKSHIMPTLQAKIITKFTVDVDKVGAFYSRLRSEVIIRESEIVPRTIAHEMAHAYSDQNWYDFLFMMSVRKMDKTDMLDEGMTTLIEKKVTEKWWAQQPKSTNTVIPLPSYDSTYQAVAKEFMDEVGENAAFQAYFRGSVNYTNNNKPEDSLEIGKDKKKWKWLWRLKNAPMKPIPKGASVNQKGIYHLVNGRKFMCYEVNDQTQKGEHLNLANTLYEKYQQSQNAILKALRLNPVKGYVKGSSARRQLEEAIESVPSSYALELYGQLKRGQASLYKLFRYRLHPVTQDAMLQILQRKHLKQKQQLQLAGQY